MENSVTSTGSSPLTPQDLLPALRQYAPEHPALSRMRAKAMQASGAQAISAYDRMHHRHNRS